MNRLSLGFSYLLILSHLFFSCKGCEEDERMSHLDHRVTLNGHELLIDCLDGVGKLFEKILYKIGKIFANQEKRRYVAPKQE